MTYEIRLVHKVNYEGDVVDSWYLVISDKIRSFPTWQEVKNFLEIDD